LAIQFQHYIIVPHSGIQTQCTTTNLPLSNDTKSVSTASTLQCLDGKIISQKSTIQIRHGQKILKEVQKRRNKNP